MANLFFCSDHHLGHHRMYDFVLDDGVTKVRPGFDGANHADEIMIQRHNEVVKPQDHVYFLGDIAMNRKYLPLVKRMNGHKRLVFGNHDIYPFEEYAAAGFEKLMGIRVLDGFIMTHIPIHPSNFGRFKANIHGHIHRGLVRLGNGHPDPRYINVSVEQINYTPVAFEDLKKRIKNA